MKQIFLCLTLHKYCKETTCIKKVLKKSNFQVFILDEHVGEDMPKKKIIAKQLKQTDIFIIILGRNNPMVNWNNIYWQYQLAEVLSIPIIVFMLSNNYKESDDLDDKEQATNYKSYQRFKSMLNSDKRFVNIVSNEKELKDKCLQALCQYH